MRETDTHIIYTEGSSTVRQPLDELSVVDRAILRAERLIRMAVRRGRAVTIYVADDGSVSADLADSQGGARRMDLGQRLRLTADGRARADAGENVDETDNVDKAGT